MTKRCLSVSSERTKLNSALITGSVKLNRPPQHLCDYSQHFMTGATVNVVQHSGWAQIEHNTHNAHQQSASTTTLHAWRTTTDERSSLLTTLRLLARLAAGDPTNFARPRYGLERYSLTGFRVPFRYRHVYRIKSHGDMPRNDVWTCISILLELDFASKGNWFPTFRHKWPRNVEKELPS